ncbi:hypothetical protein, partial [Vibrio breoganii]
MKYISLKNMFTACALAATVTAVSAKEIIHDAQFGILERQHGEKWAAQDKEIEKKLAEIREKNGGKRPNIVYILVDDLSYGQMGSRKMNHVMGVD